MRGKISTGIWFIFWGTVVLLYNFDIISFNFWAILPYWPLLIIAIGAGLIFQNKKNGALIVSTINIGLCIFIGYIGMTSDKKVNISNSMNFSNVSNDTTGTSSHFSTPYDKGIKSAKLIVNGGALALKIGNNSSDYLFEATSSEFTGLKLQRTGDNESPVLELSSVIKQEGKNNKADITLNINPIWDLELNLGAAKLNADFKNHKISNLEINAGAASMNLALGMPVSEQSNIEVNTAASSLNISIPAAAACRVEMSTILSSRKLAGFEKKGDYFQTPNYDSASLKYNINIDGAANSLKINRY